LLHLERQHELQEPVHHDGLLIHRARRRDLQFLRSQLFVVQQHELPDPVHLDGLYVYASRRELFEPGLHLLGVGWKQLVRNLLYRGGLFVRFDDVRMHRYSDVVQYVHGFDGVWGGYQLLLVVDNQRHVLGHAEVVHHAHRFDDLRGGLQLLLVDVEQSHVHGHADHVQHVHRFDELCGGLQLLLVVIEQSDLHRHADRLHHPYDVERMHGRLQLHLEQHQHDVHRDADAVQPTLAVGVHDAGRLQLGLMSARRGVSFGPVSASRAGARRDGPPSSRLEWTVV
jgi:hypothetical protein